MRSTPGPLDPALDAVLSEVMTQSGQAGALAGVLSASVLSKTCLDALDDRLAQRAEEQLRAIIDKADSLRRDLDMLRGHEVSASNKVAALHDRPESSGQAGKLRALLFASEVPLRIGQSCHVLLTLAERALGLIGMKSIPEIATASELAFAGVTAGVVRARTRLAGIPDDAGTGAAAARARAERILSEAEIIRALIADRVRRHLP